MKEKGIEEINQHGEERMEGSAVGSNGDREASAAYVQGKVK